MDALLNRKSKIVYGLYVFIALTIWILGFFEMPEIIDVNEYKLYAKSISDGVSVFNESERLLESTRRTPFYPILIYFDGSLIIIRLFQLLCWLYYPIVSIKLKRILENEQSHSDYWVIILTSLIPVGYYYSFIAIPDVITGFLLGVWILYSLENKFILAAIISGLLIGFKPIFIFTLVLIPFFSFSYLKKWFMAQIFTVLLIISLLFFNFNRSKRWELSSVSTTNLYDYNRKLLLFHTLGAERTDSTYKFEHLEIHNDKFTDIEVSEYLKEKSFNTIMQYPLNYAYLHIKGMVTTLIDPGRFDAMVFWGWERSKGFLSVNDGHQSKKRPWFEWVYILIFLLMNILRTSLMCIGFWSNRQNMKIIWIFSLLLIYLLLIGPVGSARYLIPIIIPVISMSVIGLTRFVKFSNLTE